MSAITATFNWLHTDLLTLIFQGKRVLSLQVLRFKASATLGKHTTHLPLSTIYQPNKICFPTNLFHRCSLTLLPIYQCNIVGLESVLRFSINLFITYHFIMQKHQLNYSVSAPTCQYKTYYFQCLVVVVELPGIENSTHCIKKLLLK